MTETVTFGHPTWRAGKRTFAVIEEYGGHLTVAVKCDPLDAREWIETQPTRFFATPYVGKHGGVSLIVDRAPPATLLRQLLIESFALVAPKRVSRGH